MLCQISVKLQVLSILSSFHGRISVRKSKTHFTLDEFLNGPIPTLRYVMHLSMLSRRGGGGGGRAWGGDLTFLKNLIPCPRANPSSQMQPNFSTPGCILSRTLINYTCKNQLGFSLLPFPLVVQYLLRFN